MPLEIVIPVTIDAGDVDKRLTAAAKNGVDGVVRELQRLENEAEDVGKKNIKIEAEGTDKLSGIFKTIGKAFSDSDKELNKYKTSLLKLSSAEDGSIVKLRNKLGYDKQQISLTRAGSLANIEANNSLLKTVRTIQSASSAQRSNISLLQLEKTALDALAASQFLSFQAREKNNLAIIANTQAQLAAVGVEQNSLTAKRQLITDLQRLADSYDQGSAANIRYLAQIKRLKGELTGGSNIFRNFIDGLNKIATIQAGFTAISSIVQFFNGVIGQFVGQTKRVESFRLALENVGLSTGEVSRAFQQASSAANKLGAPLDQVEKSYKRMVPALRAVGASTEETDRFIESITARTQVLGLSTEESGRLLEAFAQVLSKGKLQSEELNQQISELDGAFRTQLADAIGVTTTELEDLIAAGAITSDKFVKAVGEMENGVEALSARVGQGNATVQQLQNLIANLQTQNIRDISKALEPGIKAFLEIGRVFQQFVADILKTQFGQFLIDSFNGVLTGIKNFIVIILEAAKAIILLLDPVFGLIRAINDLAKPFGGIIGIVTTFGAALAASTAAVQAYTAILALKAPFNVWVQSNTVARLASEQFSKTLSKFNIRNLKATLAKGISLLAAFAVKVAQIGGSVAKSLGGAGSSAVNYFDDLIEGVRRFRDIGGDITSKFKLPDFKKPAKSIDIANQSLTRYDRVIGAIKEKKAIEALKLTNPPAYAAAMEGVAKSTGGASKASLALRAAFIAKAAVVVAAVAIFASWYSTILEGERIQNALGNSTADLAKKYSDLANATRQQVGLLPALARGFKNAWKQVQNFFGLQSRQIQGVIRGFGEYEDVIFGTVKALAKEGGEVKKTADARKKSDAQLKNSLGIYKDRKSAAEQVLKVLNEELIKAQAQGVQNKDYIKTLKEKIKLAEEDAKRAQASIDLIEEEIDKRIQQGKSVEDLIDSLEALDNVTTKKINLIDLEETKKAITILKQFDNTVQGRIDQEAALTAGSVAAADARTDVYLEERKVLDKLLRDKGISYKQYSNAVIANDKKIADSQRASVEVQKEYADQVLAEFERIIQKGAELSSIYSGISQGLSGAFDGVTGAASNVISSLGSLIDSVVEREIAGLEVGNAKRKEIVTFQLRTQAQLNEIEFQIAQQKLALANRIAVIEARTVQARLTAEAAIADARGEGDVATALRDAAAAQDDIIAARQQQYQLEVQGLRIQKLVTDEALNQKAISEGINPGKNIGTAITGFGALNKIIGEVKDSTRDVGKNLADKSIKNAEKSFEEQSDAVKKAKDRVDEMKTAFEGVAGVSKIVQQTVDRIARASGKAAVELKRVANLVNAPARWMGGAVSAGQTYRVNDGGFGREAFVNQFGRMSLLPASQNINWTAPSSGTIVPAHLVRQMSKNSDINSRINVAAANVSPVVSIAASRATSSDSGNLVKRTDSAMAGSSTNQRITNNITIQSQQPVTDASRLMTEAAMQRLRRSRKY